MAKGLKILESAFPSWRVSEESLSLWAMMLADLTEEQFVRGVKKFCLEHPEIYPGTNIIAHIRNYGLGVKKRDLKADATLAYALIRANRALPNDIDAEAANEAFRLAMKSSTGMTADAMWDERRFVDLYVSLAGEGEQ